MVWNIKEEHLVHLGKSGRAWRRDKEGIPSRAESMVGRTGMLV